MRHVISPAAIAVLALLAACGQSEPERAQGGAAAGAATGAAVGLIAGPPGMLIGGLIGAGAGAATGAATSAKSVDLGAPPWSDKP